MKVDLSAKQMKSLSKGKSVQLKASQIGSGLDLNLHPMIKKKLAKAHSAGKGMRLTLSGGEIDEISGGKLSLNKVLKKVGIKKAVNKNVTEKNVKKIALKTYNKVNKELEKQGMPSIHGAILNEGLGYVPFVPQTVKTIAAHHANKYIDKTLDKESQKVGAGIAKTINRGLKRLGVKKDVQNAMKHVTKKNVQKALNYTNKTLNKNGLDNVEDIILDRMPTDKRLKGVAKDVMSDALSGGRLANPYLPTSYMTSSKGKLPMSGGSAKVFDDHRNILRPNQAGFKAPASFEPTVDPHVFDAKPMKGRGIRIGGAGFKNGAGFRN